jgi:hypothetical protein
MSGSTGSERHRISQGALTRSPDRLWDVLLAGLLFVCVAGYIGRLPLYLGAPDEPRALYEAKRLLDGEVMYRDIFEIVTPGWVYLMAGMFSLFGTTLRTARWVAAVLQGLIAVASFVACRWTGVRRPVAWAAGFAVPVVCQPLFPVASQHWLVTFLMMALLLSCIRMPLSRCAYFAAGSLVGLTALVHQQRGAAMGLAVVAIVAADGALRRWYGPAWGTPPPRGRWTRFAAGTASIAIPVLGWIVWAAGPGPVWEALIQHPLTGYRHTLSCTWGFAYARGGGWSVRAFLRYLPAALVPIGAAAVVAGWRRRHPQRVRLSVMLILMCAFSALSIYYYPDAIHLAFIAPVFFVVLAFEAEYLLRLPPRGVSAVLTFVLVSATVLPGARYLWRQKAELEATNRLRYASEFGPVDLRGPSQKRFLEQLAELVRGTPSRLLYRHPRGGYVYLLAGARNPTRFDLILPGYTSNAQMREVIHDLEAKRVPYVLLSRRPSPRRRPPPDPIRRYVEQNYEKLAAPYLLKERVWRRISNGR